jgi:nucleoside-diphosphate-sugar epimerase
VVEQLSREGHDVVALVRRSSNSTFLRTLPNVTLAYGAVEDARSVGDAIKGVDAVIHAAGLVKALAPEDFHRVNVRGTENLLDAAEQHAPGLARFVLVSSLTAIGPSDDGKPVPRTREPRPCTAYGRSKLEAERVALSRKDRLPITIIRPPLIYGPRDNECLAFFKTVARRVLPFVGDGTNTLSIVYGADAASACIRAIAAAVPSGSTYFVDDGEIYVWRDMLAELERVLDKRAYLRFSIPKSVLRGAALASEKLGQITQRPVMLTRDKLNDLLAAHWVCDSSDTRRDLGWKPEVRWAEGARQTARWYKDRGMI